LHYSTKTILAYLLTWTPLLLVRWKPKKKKDVDIPTKCLQVDSNHQLARYGLWKCADQTGSSELCYSMKTVWAYLLPRMHPYQSYFG
jgi:hypothetical protein